jgi:hypothetical protein
MMHLIFYSAAPISHMDSGVVFLEAKIPCLLLCYQNHNVNSAYNLSNTILS